MIDFGTYSVNCILCAADVHICLDNDLACGFDIFESETKQWNVRIENDPDLLG